MLEPMDCHKTWAEGRKKGYKLTAKQIKEMVRLAKNPRYTTGMLAKLFGVSPGWARRTILQFGIRRPRGRPKKDPKEKA